MMDMTLTSLKSMKSIPLILKLNSTKPDMHRVKNFPLRTLVRSFSSSCSEKSGDGSWYAAVEMAPADPILGLNDTFKSDTNPNKMNLGAGTYRDDNGKPYVLPSVRKAEEIIMAKKMNKEYLPMTGDADFNNLAARLAFGEKSEVIQKGLDATVQVLSGTGGLFTGGAFLASFFPGKKEIYMPVPTWSNHKRIFNLAGLETKTYRYYDPKIKWINFGNMLEDICAIPEGSMILFHACAHNPSGVDPSHDEWKEICQVVKKKRLFTFFDMAYQGFASGDEERDAFAVRHFTEEGHRILLTQSFSKNMGLYCERIGALTIVGDTKEEAERILSHLKPIVRRVYSVPPIHGARIVREILTDAALRKQWKGEIKGMADRVSSIRKRLVEELKAVGSKHNWEHICKQIGMFSYTGLNEEQVKKMIKEHHVYMTNDGRISIAAVSSSNVKYLAKAMHEVSKG